MFEYRYNLSCYDTTEAHYISDPEHLQDLDGQQYQTPEWVEQVILIGWSIYEEWSAGLGTAILDMMKHYHIAIPEGAGQLLPPTPPGRCGLVKGLIRTYYLEPHSDPNWSPYVALCSLTNPVPYRYQAETDMSLHEVSALVERSQAIFTHNRPFFYALLCMIKIFTQPVEPWGYDVCLSFQPKEKTDQQDQPDQPDQQDRTTHHELPYLPMEMMLEILSYLDGFSIYQMSKVSHLWRVATHSKELQKMLKFPEPRLHYLINFTTMGMGGNCGPSW